MAINWPKQKSLLQHAINNDRVQELRLAVADLVNLPDNDWELIFDAFRQKSHKCIRYIIENLPLLEAVYRTELNIDSYSGKFLCIALRNQDPETVDMLLSAGADFQAGGFEPVRWAIRMKNFPILERFLDLGLDPNFDDNSILLAVTTTPELFDYSTTIGIDLLEKLILLGSDPRIGKINEEAENLRADSYAKKFISAANLVLDKNLPLSYVRKLTTKQEIQEKLRSGEISSSFDIDRLLQKKKSLQI